MGADHQATYQPGERERLSWRRPLSFTTLVPLKAVDLVGLHQRLRDLERNWITRLEAVEDLHSFRLVVIPPDGQSSQPFLLMNCVHDRPLAVHLPMLLSVIGEELGASLCSVGVDLPADRLMQTLMRHRVFEQTFHLGAINRSVKDIRQERHLRETVQHFADEQLSAGVWDLRTAPETIFRQIRDFVLQRRDPGLPGSAREKIGTVGRLRRFWSLLVTFAFPAIGVLARDIHAAANAIRQGITRLLAQLALWLWWIYGAIPTALAFASVRLVERFERRSEAPEPDPAKVDRLVAREDQRIQNAVTIWFPVKNSFVRRLLLRVILWGSERGCRHFWTRGALADIDTIHFARIMQANNGHTMLFMSDYDGSLNRYLDDFIGVGSRAVIAISSNLAGCPETRWLFRKTDPTSFGPRWRSLIRACQLEMAVWYSAYPNLTVGDIIRNAKIRDGLFAGEANPETARNWLRLL